MRLRAGLVEESSSWRQLMSQEGFPCDVARLDELNGEEISILIVNRLLTRFECDQVEEYLGEGGALLGYSGHLKNVSGMTARGADIRYLVSEGSGPFADVSVLDLSTRGEVPKEANFLRTERGEKALFAGELGGGYAVALPFDPAEMILDDRTEKKRFYSEPERLPSEEVSLASKGEIRHLMHRALEFLHHARDLPYAHVWYYPSGHDSMFAYRVDTDGAPQSDVTDLYELARRYSQSLSWYIDGKSHESWISHFRSMEDQELSLHCYDHRTFDSYEENLDNIQSGLRVLEGAGLEPRGFAAPFGRWNHNLARAIDACGFEYSSEFSFAYDTLPLFPQHAGDRYKALQVPIHPVCIGSMLKVGYDKQRMIDYHKRTMDWKIRRKEPLFFYHHPSHRNWDVVEDLFRSAEDAGIPSITLLEFARWWKGRASADIDLDLLGDRITVTLPEDQAPLAGRLWVEVSLDGGAVTRRLASAGTVSLLPDDEWTSESADVLPADILRIREFDPRSAVGGLYDTMRRKLE